MPYVPAGPMSVALSGLQTLLANVPYFQTWTGTNNPTSAAANIFIGEVGYIIASVAIASEVLTVTTRDPHTILAGQKVTLQGASIGAQSAINVDGPYTVVSVPTPTSFTVAITAADYPSSNPEGAFVLPSSEPVACLTESDGGGSLNAKIIGTGGACVFSGAMEILFENTIPSGYANDPVNALTQARSELSQLVQGIAQTQGTLDYICLNTVDTTVAAQFVAPEQQADGTVRFERWQALVKVTWGIDG